MVPSPSSTSARPRPQPADELRDEAARFGRYLLDLDPPEALIERYARANAILFGSPSPRDRAVLGFARAHRWAVPLLDAGTALWGDAPLLRKKLLVMMAILETTPELVDQTSPVSLVGALGLPRLALRLARAGAVAAFELVAGTVLVAAVTRRRGGGGTP